MRWPRLESAAGDRRGWSILTSGPSSTASRMICSSKRSLTTPTNAGSCSTSHGGSPPPCRCQTGRWSLGRKGPHKGPQSHPCLPTCSCTMRSTCGWPGTLRDLIADRLATLGLELHPQKTKVAYCKDASRPRGDSEHTSFDFLGYTFRGRLAKGPRGLFVSFSPAISAKAKKAVRMSRVPWNFSSGPMIIRLRLRSHHDVRHRHSARRHAAGGRLAALVGADGR